MWFAYENQVNPEQANLEQSDCVHVSMCLNVHQEMSSHFLGALSFSLIRQ